MTTQPADFVSNSSSNRLNRQISQYSLAAAVAGVSMLALTAPAVGEVVVTKKTIHIPLATDGMLQPVKISMANNGINNFVFSMYTAGTYRHLLIGGSALSDQLLAVGGFDVYAAALRRGARIGPSNPTSPFFYYFGIGEISNSFGNSKFFRGSWGGNPRNRYLGVRFPINGQIHYGWIRLTVTTNPDPRTPVMSATITGYAYETVANKAIAAGTAAIAPSTLEAATKPTAQAVAPKDLQNGRGPSLGMLALGSDALPLWRREESLVQH